MTLEQLAGKAGVIGKVFWDFKHAGYIAGLERIGDKMNLNSKKLLGKDFTRVYWFAQDVAIAVSKPQNNQSNPLKTAADLIKDGLLTESELAYIYDQFGFVPNKFVPPNITK